tara:strand:+ start:401 stop:853 length:453 start_codon:yes stop_codon:yes gene_type:complete
MPSAQELCAAVVYSSFPRADVACKYMNTVIEASEKYNLEPSLLVAMIRVESNWKTTAVSHAKACGLTQVLAKYSPYSCRTLVKKPIVSIMEGAKKLHYWIYKYGRGNKKVGLCGYNAGFRCKGKYKNKQGFFYANRVLHHQMTLNEKTIL